MGKRDEKRDVDAGGKDESVDAAGEFLAAIGRVRRLPEVAAAPQPPKPRAAATMRQADERAALAESMRDDPMRDADIIGDTVAYRRDDVPAQTLRRLKRAEFAIEDEIDLHALNECAAEDVLRQFLAEVRDAAHHCVRIVHGKGLHSPQGPVLKGLVERVLNHRADVLAYASAPPAHGGTGAMLVLLARRRPGELRPAFSRHGKTGD